MIIKDMCNCGSPLQGSSTECKEGDPSFIPTIDGQNDNGQNIGIKNDVDFWGKDPVFNFLGDEAHIKGEKKMFKIKTVSTVSFKPATISWDEVPAGVITLLQKPKSESPEGFLLWEGLEELESIQTIKKKGENQFLLSGLDEESIEFLEEALPAIFELLQEQREHEESPYFGMWIDSNGNVSSRAEVLPAVKVANTKRGQLMIQTIIKERTQDLAEYDNPLE